MSHQKMAKAIVDSHGNANVPKNSLHTPQQATHLHRPVNLLAPELFFKFQHILYIKCE